MPGDSAALTHAFPLVIEHPWGRTIIEAKPERIVAVGWGNQDVALALGLVPVGYERQRWSRDGGQAGGATFPWTNDALARLGAEMPVVFDRAEGGNVDHEAIAATRPDVILAAGRSNPRTLGYETLSLIAPVVPPPDYYYGARWRDSIRCNSAALGLSTEGDVYIARVEDLIAEATTDAGFEGKTAAFFSIGASDLSTVGVLADDGRTALLEDLGFDTPHVVIDVRDSGGRFANASAGQLADVDIIVTYRDEALVRALGTDPRWQALPAVKNGAVIAIPRMTISLGRLTPPRFRCRGRCLAMSDSSGVQRRRFVDDGMGSGERLALLELVGKRRAGGGC